MKKFNIYLSFFILLASCSGKGPEANQSNLKKAIPVRVAAVDTAIRLNAVTASGLISTEDEARLSFKIGGVIERILVEEGQQVRKGQLLASLNSTEITAQVQQAELALEKAKRDYERAAILFKDSVVTLEQFQNIKTALDLTKQNLQQVLFNSKYASIYAPSDGFILKKILNVGEIIGAGSPVLLMGALDKTSKWVLRVGVADKEWALIETGNKAMVSIDAFPGRSFLAVVSKKALIADLASGSFEIQLILDLKGLQPAIGMFGKAIITPSKPIKGFSIPYEALLEANGQKGFVFVTKDQKTVHRIEVTIASIENNRVILSDGLSDYPFVIISGSPYLTEGANINITR